MSWRRQGERQSGSLLRRVVIISRSSNPPFPPFPPLFCVSAVASASANFPLPAVRRYTRFPRRNTEKNEEKNGEVAGFFCGNKKPFSFFADALLNSCCRCRPLPRFKDGRRREREREIIREFGKTRVRELVVQKRSGGGGGEFLLPS